MKAVLCVNCAHFTPRKNLEPACGHPETPREPVYGKPYTSCMLNRELEEACGMAGRRYQPSTKVGEASVHSIGQPVKGV